MPIDFEDEDELEYPEGLEVFTELMSSEAMRISAESSTSPPVMLSERPRNFTIQRATMSNRSPSPMDVDSGANDMLGQEPTSSFTAVATSATEPSATSAMRPPMGAVTVPCKRPTDVHETSGPRLLAPSPSTLPQSAKRLHATSGAVPPRPPQTVSEFGRDLNTFFIAHDPSAQALLDAGRLAWGTVYEVARGITKGSWQWSSVTKEKVGQLRGANVQTAPNVAAVIKGNALPRPTATEVWSEYDREQDAIIENDGRGLGGKGLWKGKDDWYGGRIQQVGRLVRQAGQFAIQLEKPEIRRSHRFSRFLGSRRILQVRVAEDILYKYGDEVRTLLYSSKFILCGRVFLPFHAKEGSMYLVETSQDFERVPSRDDGDHLRISLNAFINWHNPLHLNSQQPISKWSTRWALGLSTSVPTIVFDPQHIYEIPDIYVSPKDWEGKAPAEKVLTDGCGFINGAALTQIMRLMKYGSRPTAVQGRIGGSKGMWVLHFDPLEQVPDGPAKIWIRPSQTKIKLGPASTLGEAQRMFDLLAPSRVTSPSRLSSQTLINLSFNGIDHQILKDLMAQGLREEIRPFLELKNSQNMVMVWRAVEKAGSVVMSRLRRMLGGQARALGLGQLQPVENQNQVEEEDGNMDSFQPSIITDHNKFSGQPVTLHESVLELLQAGFNPLELNLLFQKLEFVMTLILNDYVEKFHIPVVESCEAYIVPDPYGVLNEGEIHFRLSEPIVSSLTGEQMDIILGEVLVSRNPTRLPSDIQKVQAVRHPKLSNYFNVIVFSIKGKQSLASLLGGGDYDGDTVMLNWHKPLVKQFKGSSPCTAPTNLSDFFEREVEHVRDFDKRVSTLQPKEAQQGLQKVLLLGLAETRVGLYSKYHDAAVYECGYGSHKAIHLAYMFTTCLDASKTGLRVKLPIFNQDKQQWGAKTPWYTWKLEQGKNSKNGNGFQKPYMKRQDSPFILDVLVEEGENLRKEMLQEYRSLKAPTTEEDCDLLKPWFEAKDRAVQARICGIPGFSENLKDIEIHVEEAWKGYQKAVAINELAKSTESLSSSSGHFDKAAGYFAGSPKFRGFIFFSEGDIQTLKASFACTKSICFAFSVAFNRLCTIKAQAQAGGHLTLAQQFVQCMTVPNVVARMLSQPSDDT